MGAMAVFPSVKKLPFVLSGATQIFKGKICNPRIPVAHMQWVTKKLYSVNQLTKNMELIVLDKDAKVVKSGTSPVPVVQNTKKPLVLLLPWLMAKKCHLQRYKRLYTDQGFDVLTTHITPWQMMWPRSGSHLVARDLAQFLHHNTSYDRLFIHSFSVGAYVWAETLNQFNQRLDIYQPTVGRIVGQIWDSFADLEQITKGFPQAVFPKNEFLRSIIKMYIQAHVKLFYNVATRHYDQCSKMFHHNNLVTAPALFLLSKTDPVGQEATIRRLRDAWSSRGVETYWKCWDRSPHVDHFRKHPEEYLAEMGRLLQRVDLLPFPDRLRV